MPTDPDFQRNRVLIVEDELATATDMEEEFERHGLHVIAVACYANEAKLLATVLDFEAAVISLNLAGRPPFEVVRPIVQRNIPVLFIGSERSLTVPEWTSQPPLIRKPVDSSTVAQMLRAMLG